MKKMLISALLVTGLGALQAQPACERVLYVGSWNIQWLGNAVAGKRAPQNPSELASYIAASKVDVLALAEISVTSRDAKGRASSKPLDDAFIIANQSGSKWRYELFHKRDGARAPEDQWTGVAWNEAAITKTGGPWKLDVSIDLAKEDAIRQKMDKPEPDTIVFSRWPYAVKFSAGQGKTDFVVVPVHMKSNIGGAATAEARTYEAKLLLEAFGKLKPEQRDQDLIILGDTNMLVANEPAAAELKAAGLRDCNAGDIGTHLTFQKGEKSAPFDRIFVMSAQPETSGSCPKAGIGKGAMDFKVLRPEDWQPGLSGSDFRKRLSDHQLVRAGVCAMADDD